MQHAYNTTTCSSTITIAACLHKRCGSAATPQLGDAGSLIMCRRVGCYEGMHTHQNVRNNQSYTFLNSPAMVVERCTAVVMVVAT
jgi:hypothetical protein